MSTFRIPMVAFVRVGFTIFAALLAAAPVAADFDKPELTAEQKEQVRAALKAFGTAGGNLEKQQQAVDDAIAAGPHAAGPLVKRVDSRFRSELKKYQKSAHKAAARLGDKRLVTAADEMLADNPRLQKSRKSLEELAAMHVALQSAAGTDGATSGAAAATAAADNAAGKMKDADEDRPLSDQLALIESIALGIGAPGMSQREVDCVLWVNRTRVKLNLRPLVADGKLSDSARMHSRDMVEHQFMSHESPLPGKKTFRDRGMMFGTRADGENLARGDMTGQQIVDYWMDSPPHKANIVHPKFRRIGVGLHNDVWTQVFGGVDSFKR